LPIVADAVRAAPQNLAELPPRYRPCSCFEVDDAMFSVRDWHASALDFDALAFERAQMGVRRCFGESVSLYDRKAEAFRHPPGQLRGERSRGAECVFDAP